MDGGTLPEHLFRLCVCVDLALALSIFSSFVQDIGGREKEMGIGE